MIKKAVICVSLFLLVQALISLAAADITRNLFYYPEDYEGKTLVFKEAKIGGPIVKHSRTGVYCLHVEINGKYIPGALYKNQLNFVAVSPELADKLTTRLNRNLKYHKPRHELNLMDRLYSVGACSVRLTAKIQKRFGYWMAIVSKVEFCGKEGTKKDTIK
ncbi:MAG: hypothetical protein H8E19_10870 [Deltaproteobacteria bacterium]|uniref:Uncharacterized protein n=1 Tax=Candidatus Desulfacyla euxinica TaxID=2841693 RepID=A0A8J6N168_9DELT|nr:hypothetical protein [Candidatus Desulfacyla euxinica]MBL7218081.1 hypothetical protein [Desulfobacteraceae bacterium]